MCPAARDFGPPASNFDPGILADCKEKLRRPGGKSPAGWVCYHVSNKPWPDREFLRFQTAAALLGCGLGPPLRGGFALSQSSASTDTGRALAIRMSADRLNFVLPVSMRLKCAWVSSALSAKTPCVSLCIRELRSLFPKFQRSIPLFRHHSQASAETIMSAEETAKRFLRAAHRCNYMKL